MSVGVSRHLKATAMLASIVFRASLVLNGLLNPYVVAAPGSTTVVTPFGERHSTEVHVVPHGMHPRLAFRKTIFANTSIRMPPVYRRGWDSPRRRRSPSC
jgi:hypothetical protein